MRGCEEVPDTASAKALGCLPGRQQGLGWSQQGGEGQGGRPGARRQAMKAPAGHGEDGKPPERAEGDLTGSVLCFCRRL